MHACNQWKVKIPITLYIGSSTSTKIRYYELTYKSLSLLNCTCAIIVDTMKVINGTILGSTPITSVRFFAMVINLNKN